MCVAELAVVDGDSRVAGLSLPFKGSEACGPYGRLVAILGISDDGRVMDGRGRILGISQNSLGLLCRRPLRERGIFS